MAKIKSNAYIVNNILKLFRTNFLPNCWGRDFKRNNLPTSGRTGIFRLPSITGPAPAFRMKNGQFIFCEIPKSADRKDSVSGQGSASAFRCLSLREGRGRVKISPVPSLSRLGRGGNSGSFRSAPHFACLYNTLKIKLNFSIFFLHTQRIGFN